MTFPLLLLVVAVQAAPAPPQALELREELRIGSVDTPPYLLTEVGDLAVANGQVFVAQPKDGQVRVFDTAGRFIRAVGRQGEGPGEFRSIASIGVRADTLWVVDRYNARVTAVDLEGRVLDTRQVQGLVVPGAGRPLTPNAILGGGFFLGVTRVEGGSAGTQSDDAELVLQMDTSGRVTGKFAEHDITGALGRIMTGRRALHFTRPLRGSGLTRWSTDGSLVGLLDQRSPRSSAADSFRITLLRSPRDTVYSRWYRFQPAPVTRVIADSIRQVNFRELAEIGINRLLAQRVIEDSLGIPNFLPAVREFVIGLDGTVLVGREAGEGERSWLVLNRRGDFVAHFSAPAALKVLDFGGGSVWGTIRDDLDVPYVVRFRLLRAAAPGG